MSDPEHARSLLKMAEGDRNALRGIMSPTSASISGLFSDEVFGFHAQQAAEKCLKAWVASLGERYSRTHDIKALLDMLDSLGRDTSGLDSLVDLNPFGVQYRYESFAPDDEDLDRPALLREIEDLFEKVDAIVNSAPAGAGRSSTDAS